MNGLCKCKSTQSCLTLWDPMDYTVQGILQARILEWVTFPFSRGSSQPRDGTQVSRIAGEFFTSWATKKALVSVISQLNCQGKIQLGKFIWEYFSESLHTYWLSICSINYRERNAEMQDIIMSLSVFHFNSIIFAFRDFKAVFRVIHIYDYCFFQLNCYLNQYEIPLLYNLNIYIYLFILGVLGLCCCGSYFLVEVRGLHTVVVSLVSEHRLWCM